MRCDKVRELIMTDYIDGEIDPRTEKLVKEHLGECASCRAFEKGVLEKAVAPFRDVKEPPPPERVWNNIARSIAAESSPAGAFDELRERISVMFALPRFRVAVATLAVAILALTVFGYHRYAEERALDAYIGEQAVFLSGLEENGDDAADDYFETGNFLQINAV